MAEAAEGAHSAEPGRKTFVELSSELPWRVRALSDQSGLTVRIKGMDYDRNL